MLSQIPTSLKLVVFDLDDTLLKRGIDTTIDIHVRDIIAYFREHGVKVSLASMNYFAAEELFRNKLLHMFDFVQMRKFDDECDTLTEKQLNMGNRKDYMFRRILKASNIPPKNSILFDDNLLHVWEARKMGMKAILVQNEKCIRWSDIIQGIHIFRAGKNRRKSCQF